MGSRCPFALFAVVDLDHKKIDEILGVTFPLYAPAFWLTTDKYDAPKKQYDSNDGTKPPISKSFESPWIGKPAKELVEWLKGKPDDTDLNERKFAILDRGARDDPPTIVVCRIEDPDAEDHGLVLRRMGVRDGVDQLIGAPNDWWKEYARYAGNAEIRYDNDDEDV